MKELLLDKLRILGTDKTMLEALKMAFQDILEDNKPDIEKTDNNEVLGEKFRAYEQAKKIINQTIMDIESYNQLKVDNSQINKGK